MPEQATSTMSSNGWLSGRIRLMAGVPDTTVIHDSIPRKFAIVFAACVLPTLSNEPTLLRKTTGGGVRKVRKTIGKMASYRVVRLNRIRIRPETNKGREIM